MSQLFTPGERPGPWDKMGDAVRRIARLEAVRPPDPTPYIVWGAITNDGAITAGSGFTVQWSGSPGAWSAVTNYVPGDLVSIVPDYYLCKMANLNQSPPNATYWEPIPAASNVYTIMFLVPFTNPPIVPGLAANNDNPPDVDGRYTVSLMHRHAGYIVVLTVNVDDPDSLSPQDGGFDFLAMEDSV